MAVTLSLDCGRRPRFGCSGSSAGHIGEGRQWLAALLRARGTVVHSAARAKALFTAGILAFYQRDHAAGRQLHEEGLALQRQLKTFVYLPAVE